MEVPGEFVGVVPAPIVPFTFPVPPVVDVEEPTPIWSCVVVVPTGAVVVEGVPAEPLGVVVPKVPVDPVVPAVPMVPVVPAVPAVPVVPMVPVVPTVPVLVPVVPIVPVVPLVPAVPVVVAGVVLVVPLVVPPRAGGPATGAAIPPPVLF